MTDEIDVIKKRKVWELVTKPNDAKVVGCRWVYNVKRNHKGEAVRYKARLVAKGFNQYKGINYDEIFSPVINFSIIRLFFTILICFCHWTHEQLDIKNAYLYANLDETIFMQQPKGFENKSQPDHVCLLKKALYGLKQSGRAWFFKIAKTLGKIGFTQLKQCNGVFHKNAEVVLLLYVDDIVLLGKTEKLIKENIKILSKKFDLKLLGKTKQLLGVEFQEERGILTLSQSNYIDEIYERFKIFKPPISSLPISKGLILSKLQSPTTDEGIREMQEIPFRNLIGCLSYLSSRTRPDIAYAINMYSQFQSNPGMTHWNGLLRVLGYVKATSHYRLNLSTITDLNINLYCDSDFAANRDDRTSTGGLMLMVDKAPIMWRVNKHKQVSLSTMESEFVTMVDAAKEMLWFQNVMLECDKLQIFNFKKASRTIWCDNQAAIAFASSPIENSSSKHISVKYFFIRNLIHQKAFKVSYISTKLNVADALTKPQSNNDLRKFCKIVFQLNN